MSWERACLLTARVVLQVTGTPERVVGPKMDPANKDEEKHFVWAIPVRINCNVQVRAQSSRGFDPSLTWVGWC